jgi:hypothetical protein
MPVHLGAIMSRRTPSTRLVEAARRRDEGAILTLTLVLMVFGALVIGAILTFTLTVLKARPPLDERTTASETARSAIRVALHEQRVAGPDGCYRLNQSVNMNGVTADITCTIEALSLDNPLMRNRFGVLTTANVFTDGASLLAPIYGSSASVAPKAVSGSVFLNGGDVDSLTADIVLATAPIGTTYVYPPAIDANRYSTLATPQPCGPGLATAYALGMTCIAEPWPARAGYSADAVTWTRPALPPLPTTLRSSTPLSIPLPSGGSCSVFYPGRYTTPLALSSGEYFFTSGVYYFEDPITISNGAKVVAGEGNYAACMLDADAALYQGPTADQSAPKNHGISGRGATFLLGDDAMIAVDGASLLMNRRLSNGTTRATEGIAIRSIVSTGIDTPEVWVPADVIDLMDGSPTTPASTPVGGVSYLQSSITWNSPIVDIDYGTTTSNNEVRINGMVYVPNAKVEFSGTTSSYAAQVLGGIVATRLGLDLAQMPTSPDANYHIGTKTAAQQTLFRFDATVVAPSGQITKSSAMLQLNIDGTYAVNTWTLDTNTGSTTPPTTTTTTTTTTTLPPTTTTTTTTTTTLPPTTTTTLPPTTTTTLPPTTTTTLPPTTTTTTVPVAGCPGTTCRIEAESVPRAGSFQQGNGGGVTYVYTQNGTGNDYSGPGSSSLTFTFYVTEAGTYKIQGRTRADSSSGDSDNSFWIRVDSGTAYRWNTNANQTWTTNWANNNSSNLSWTLTPGTHTVTLYKREDGTRIDWLELVKQ